MPYELVNLEVESATGQISTSIGHTLSKSAKVGDLIDVALSGNAPSYAQILGIDKSRAFISVKVRVVP